MKAYYQALQRCQGPDKDVTPWMKWFLQTFIEVIHKSESIVKIVLEKADFWQKHRQVELNSRQRKVLNKLLDYGKSNFKGGLNTRKYTAMTKVSKATAFRDLDDFVSGGLSGLRWQF